MDTQTISQEVTVLHADICSALAEPRRILLLYALAEKPYTVMIWLPFLALANQLPHAT